MEDKLKVLSKDGLEHLIKKIEEDYVTKEEFNYKPIAINSFNNNKNTVEMGATVTDVTLNWTLNKKATSLTLDGTSVPVTDVSKTFTAQSIKANKTYTLKATDEKNATATKTTAITFLNGVYWGAKAEPGTYDSAFVLTLSKALQGAKAKTFTVNAGAEEYIYYALPSRFGTPTFNVGGFDGGFAKISTIEFTNASGYIENYDIWKSVNSGLGNTNVTVK